MGNGDFQKWIDIEDGWEFWHQKRERVILLWMEGGHSQVGIGSFHGGAWQINGKGAQPYNEGDIQPTHFIPLPDKPDSYDDWEY